MHDSESHYRVVVQGTDGAIKGYAEKSQWATANGSLSAEDQKRASIRLTRLDSGTTEEVPLEKVKAVFFVHDSPVRFSGATCASTIICLQRSASGCACASMMARRSRA